MIFSPPNEMFLRDIIKLSAYTPLRYSQKKNRLNSPLKHASTNASVAHWHKLSILSPQFLTIVFFLDIKKVEEWYFVTIRVFPFFFPFQLTPTLSTPTPPNWKGLENKTWNWLVLQKIGNDIFFFLISKRYFYSPIFQALYSLFSKRSIVQGLLTFFFFLKQPAGHKQIVRIKA